MGSGRAEDGTRAALLLYLASLRDRSAKDYSKEPSTLVEFRLEPKGDGTLLTLTESGFSKLPADRRLEAFRMNDGGWTEQMKNIERHVEQTS